ncbi:MAG: mechanosensitive ion channel family protein [Oligoflexia bacterium]|nr:mechanosensitive ion channel family protein [Oligoflexia bacterium]
MTELLFILEKYQTTHWAPWITSLLIFLFFTCILFFVHKGIWKQLYRIAQKTDAEWDDELLTETRTPGRIIFIILALIIAFHLSSIEVQKFVMLQVLAKNILILSVLWLAHRFLSVFIKHSRFFNSFDGNSKTYLLTTLNVFATFIGVLIILDAIGISITPILASLGVGSLAIALALQDTLSNFFSGVYTLIDKPVRQGDFIKIEGSVEGTVLKIGWRSTRILLTSGNEVIVPNSKLAQAIVTNYAFPCQKSTTLVAVCVAYDQDLKKIEETTLSVAMKVQKEIEGADKDFEPVIRYGQLGENGIGFNVVLQVNKINDQYLVKHEFIKRLVLKYQGEDIKFALPPRNVYLQKSQINLERQ